ncbi:MAG: isocitrate lyase/phosphoenolpyruvate mutase family protein [Hyphomicrobiales bacterium]|nr:MAG: isocitrate lyase/phosphoenolpyruvate mutase family protein [Hyphomicrobiales bacterium]
MDQAAKGRAFKALHEREKLFVIPNPWDAGSAKILASMGFEALTTTSAGTAFQLGRPDGEALVTRDETIANAALVAGAVDLPVAGDLENGFGPTPEDAAETIRRAAAAGLVGGSIEDASGNPANPIYDFSLAVERVAAAAETASNLGFDFTFVARAENFLHGRRDLDDTLKRLQAYEKAGADVLFAPALPSLDAIRTICRELGKPVNVVMSPKGTIFTVAELEDAGVRRISVGGSFFRAALTGLRDAATEVRDHGTFTYLDRIMGMADITPIMRS